LAGETIDKCRSKDGKLIWPVYKCHFGYTIHTANRSRVAFMHNVKWYM